MPYQEHHLRLTVCLEHITPESNIILAEVIKTIVVHTNEHQEIKDYIEAYHKKAVDFIATF